ncbi:S8 family peptidase [bacterium]|nr:S8 family peptidase [bacterium]
MNLPQRFPYLLLALLLVPELITAQLDQGTTIDSIDSKYINWYNCNNKSDKKAGSSVDMAYQSILTEISPKKKIVVAVIDGGVDIHHEDLKGKIWKNIDEIPDNGIDDDNNGYIDDIHGWNFIGNSEGENIKFENFEYTRVVVKYAALFDSICSEEDVEDSNLANYKLYLKCKKRYNKEYKTYSTRETKLVKYIHTIDSALSILKPYTYSDNPTYKQIKYAYVPHHLMYTQKNLLKNYKRLSRESAVSILERAQKFTKYYLNKDLNARAIVGDNNDDFKDTLYGNNIVFGPRAEHGTFVAGIIAANRDNGIGINGIATHTEIMVLRTVPDGDEDDKDVALSIKYAVDNGANVINMSFGKDYSPNKYMVDEAIKYAEEKGVLLVHAAGNDGNDLDRLSNFPNATLESGDTIGNWITVGASTIKAKKKYAAFFSNYGQNSVDLFAPGFNIVSLYPQNKYKTASGTSFSSPVVAGVAALVWSYYPELTVSELKSVVLSSVDKYEKKVLIPNVKSPKKEKVPFNVLSKTGGAVNAYQALLLAQQISESKVQAQK